MNSNHWKDDFPPFDTYQLYAYLLAKFQNTHLIALWAESSDMLITFGVYAVLLAVIAWEDLRLGESKYFFKA